MKHDYIDKYSDIDSFLHRRDPRVKIISFVSFILFIVLSNPRLYISFALYGCLITILILLSKIPLGHILKRSFSIIPFVLVVAVFIPFLKEGEPVLEIPVSGRHLVVTYEGLILLWNILIKAYLSALCIILMMSSMRFVQLLKALEEMKLPKIIVMIFSFMYRYIFVLQDELEKMKRAKESRSIGNKKWFQIRVFSNMLGVLFIKSYEKGESVYLAMCSRGFDGTIRTFEGSSLTGTDALFLSVIVILLAGIRILGEGLRY
jgi:cobalt/nickel transport system permease protein